MSPSRYEAPQQWAAGPDLVYGELARAAVALLPPADLVLDAGTGTGAVARALLARGARVLAVDASLPMLQYGPVASAVAADLCALPLRADCVDAAIAGFVLSHVPDPLTGLAELVRVVRPGGTVLCTAFPAGPDAPRHPAKAALERVLLDYGYQPPGWYLEIKDEGEQRVGDPDELIRLASAAGLGAARVDRFDVELADLGLDGMVRWRFGMPQVVPWLAEQSPARRGEIGQAARAALDATPVPPMPMLVLRGETG